MAAVHVILAARGLSKILPGTTAVDGIELTVEHGTIHELIGPNGAGKTTCFNLLTEFLSPRRETIVFAGRDITRTAPADVAQLGPVRSSQIPAAPGLSER